MVNSQLNQIVLCEEVVACGGHSGGRAVFTDKVFGVDELAEAYAALAAGGHFGKIAIRLDW